MWSKEFILLLGLLIVLVICLVIRGGLGKKCQNVSKCETRQEIIKENYDGNDFYIYNYLNKPIRVESGKGDVIVAHIGARQSKGLKFSFISKYFLDDHKFNVYLLNNVNGVEEKALFSEYKFDLPEGETIKHLHVGMVTARWVGATQDSTAIPGLNAVQGRPWIKIHNLTDRTLSLNNNIDISPNGVLRYSGRDHFGVRLGTVFKDQDGVFPTFIFDTPATDLYYGVTSDLQQPLFGGFQLDAFFKHSAEEPQFLLEKGWMGGPAHGNIPLGFLPIEGPAVSPADRWGQKASLVLAESDFGGAFD